MQIFPQRIGGEINKPAGEADGGFRGGARAAQLLRHAVQSRPTRRQQEPDDAALEPLVNARVADDPEDVQTCVGMKSPKTSISVDMYLRRRHAAGDGGH